MFAPMVRLSEIALSITDGDHQAPPKASNGVPFLTIAAINNGRLAIDRATRHVPEAYFAALKPDRKPIVGDVLFSVTGSIAIPAIVDDPRPFTFQRHIALIRPDPSVVDTRYLWHMLQTVEIKDQAHAVATGTAQLTIPISGLRNFLVPLPSLPEQRRIVAKLDSLSAKSKRSRDHLNHISRLVEKYKQAILAAAFRGELTREWRGRRQISISKDELEALRVSKWEIERDRGKVRGRYSLPDDMDWQPALDLPPGWILASVDQIAFLVQYGSSAKTTDDHLGVAVLRMGNIQNGKMNLTSLKFLPENHDEFPNLLLEDGDALFNRTNSAELVGKTAVYRGQPERASFASYLIRVRCSGLLPDLLSGYINSAYGREWVASVVNQQVGQANVNGTKLRRLGVPVMAQAEQYEIAHRVERAFTWIDRLATEATSARKLIDNLDQAILAKAFRGGLVPQDPNDEPASVLLERIKAERASGGTQTRRRSARTAS